MTKISKGESQFERLSIPTVELKEYMDAVATMCRVVPAEPEHRRKARKVIRNFHAKYMEYVK